MKRHRFYPNWRDAFRSIVKGTAYTPWPWQKCHCGAQAEWRYPRGGAWCMPCKFSAHETCKCSQGGKRD